MAPHFAQQLRKWLIDWADRNDYNIYTDGLVVHTTIDSRLQNWANQAVARQTRTLQGVANGDRKSTRLNSSHLVISYAVFCLKKKNIHCTYILTDVTALFSHDTICRVPHS